jgi:tyrosyl-tRNA synthetase
VLQIGGSDQWGNIIAGVRLVRQKLTASVHALTVPLVTAADGTKFGKSTGGGNVAGPRDDHSVRLVSVLRQHG